MFGRRQRKVESRSAHAGRLLSRPAGGRTDAPAGTWRLELSEGREALLHVPAAYAAETPAPFALMLHGAGGTAEQGLTLLRDFAEEAGVIVLAPKSDAPTWDLLRGGFGPDVELIDWALGRTFAEYAVSPECVAVGGFSDGASYALSLGLTNGELFTHVLALSPGFVSPGELEGAPRIFVSHGTRDPVLPINRCSRRLVTTLRDDGYEVLYREFEGHHAVPPEVACEAVEFLLAEL